MKHVLNGILLILFFIINLAQVCYAQNLWVVSNDPGFVADFDTIQEAIDAAATGDKIYVHGTPFVYNGSLTLTKKLHIVGPGYWKSENSISDENLNEADVNGIIYLNPGSDSTIIEGLRCRSILINSDDIIIRHNQICCFGAIELDNLPQNIFIYNNYIDRCLEGSGINVNVFNNICPDTWDLRDNFWYNANNNVNCVFQNNSLKNSWHPNNSSVATNVIFRNNISDCLHFELIDCPAIENNIFEDDIVLINGIPTDSLGNGNIDDVDIATVWNLSDPSPDGKYRLIGDTLTNPAIGAGINGEDCGAYGGDIPYRLSGIVKIPVIYQMILPFVGDTTNMLNIKIKAKSN